MGPALSGVPRAALVFAVVAWILQLFAGVVAQPQSDCRTSANATYLGARGRLAATDVPPNQTFVFPVPAAGFCSCTRLHLYFHLTKSAVLLCDGQIRRAISSVLDDVADTFDWTPSQRHVAYVSSFRFQHAMAPASPTDVVAARVQATTSPATAVPNGSATPEEATAIALPSTTSSATSPAAPPTCTVSSVPCAPTWLAPPPPPTSLRLASTLVPPPPSTTSHVPPANVVVPPSSTSTTSSARIRPPTSSTFTPPGRTLPATKAPDHRGHQKSGPKGTQEAVIEDDAELLPKDVAPPPLSFTAPGAGCDIEIVVDIDHRKLNLTSMVPFTDALYRFPQFILFAHESLGSTEVCGQRYFFMGVGVESTLPVAEPPKPPPDESVERRIDASNALPTCTLAAMGVFTTAAACFTL